MIDWTVQVYVGIKVLQSLNLDGSALNLNWEVKW